MKQTTCCKDPTSSLFRVKRGLQISKSFLRRPKQVSITFLAVECFMLNIFLWLVGCCPSLHRLRWNCCLHYGVKDPWPFVCPPSTSQLTLFLISLHFFIKKKENRTEEVCEPRRWSLLKWVRVKVGRPFNSLWSADISEFMRYFFFPDVITLLFIRNCRTNSTGILLLFCIESVIYFSSNILRLRLKPITQGTFGILDSFPLAGNLKLSLLMRFRFFLFDGMLCSFSGPWFQCYKCSLRDSEPICYSYYCIFCFEKRASLCLD